MATPDGVTLTLVKYAYFLSWVGTNGAFVEPSYAVAVFDEEEGANSTLTAAAVDCTVGSRE
jgi:hypothetical protein